MWLVDQRDDEHAVATQQQTSRPKRSEKGASLVEYVLLLSLIVVVCIVSIGYFGGSVGDRFSHTASSIEGAP